MADIPAIFFDTMMTQYTLKSTAKRKYHRNIIISKTGTMLDIILFHNSGYRCLKHFYQEKIRKHMH